MPSVGRWYLTLLCCGNRSRGGFVVQVHCQPNTQQTTIPSMKGCLAAAHTSPEIVSARLGYSALLPEGALSSVYIYHVIRTNPTTRFVEDGHSCNGWLVVRGHQRMRRSVAKAQNFDSDPLSRSVKYCCNQATRCACDCTRRHRLLCLQHFLLLIRQSVSNFLYKYHVGLATAVQKWADPSFSSSMIGVFDKQERIGNKYKSNSKIPKFQHSGRA